MAALWEGPFQDLDPLSMTTIVQLQIEDAAGMLASVKGKQREGSAPPDSEVALRTYMEHLQSREVTLNDRKMAQSIATAVLQDGALIQEESNKEHQVAKDREFAARLSRGTTASVDIKGTGKAGEKEQEDDADPWGDDEMLAKVATIYMHEPAVHPPVSDLHYHSDDSAPGESSSKAAAQAPKIKPARRLCAACEGHKEFFQVARLPCHHEYCRQCLEDLFALSMKDETLFPPRCDGQEIPLALVRPFLSAALADEFETRYEELSTTNRTYCFDPSCATFIPPAAAAASQSTATTSTDNDIIACPKCKKTTCAICKSPSHTGDCPEDTALKELIDTANGQQWQRCYRCNRFVELTTGCNHMTCLCGAHFCYICGLRWKTCACEHWHEDRLLERAAQIVARNPRRQLYQPPRVAHVQPGSATATRARTPPVLDRAAHDRLLRQTADHLRTHHECTHTSWREVDGRHTCEECREDLFKYIFECEQCRLQICNRCKMNRRWRALRLRV